MHRLRNWSNGCEHAMPQVKLLGSMCLKLWHVQEPDHTESENGLALAIVDGDILFGQSAQARMNSAASAHDQCK